MFFNSLEFLIFFPIVVLGYFVIPKKIKMYWLLVASYYFYMCWNAKYALLILLSTVITYLSGLLIEKIKQSNDNSIISIRKKKLVVATSFIINLGILCFFKYSNFLMDTVSDLFGLFNVQLNVPQFDILLPVGISFYTFQALSYTVDVYRDEIYAEKNFFKYALFVSFFPQLVAGPIERSKNLLKQLEPVHKFDFIRARDGFVLMIWGFFLKLVVADRIGIFVDSVYSSPETYPGWFLIIATVLFGIQIYCDFYGYSTIATGAARILGIQLMENFNAPYISFSVGEFWRKWHISLTSWFKDYLYIPLGGSRKGEFRKYVNKMIVFLVSGLWHGASLSFILWGGINGLYQVIGESTKAFRDKIVSLIKINRNLLIYRIFQVTVTFILVDFAWLFFRAGDISTSATVLRNMFSSLGENIFSSGRIFECGLSGPAFVVVIISILILLFSDILKRNGVCIREKILGMNIVFRFAILIISICTIFVFGVWGSGYDSAGFIYFQF